MPPRTFKPLAAIACGGTGGHLFPGLAVGRELLQRDWDVLLLVSPKEVDQQAVRSVQGMQITTLPAVGLTRGRVLGFVAGFFKSHRLARAHFQARPPQAILAMGGFTSAPPVLAARSAGAAAFLHESNAIPGRANRWLARVVDEAFVGFEAAVRRLRARRVTVTGTPVRSEFEPLPAPACRAALGLDPAQPVLLTMGGSQGATAINQLLVRSLPELRRACPALQFIHLTGPNDADRVADAYRQHQARAVVRPFLSEMELALGAATAAVSRSGASSLSEFAAMRLPVVLIPLPTAADNHQLHNALVMQQAGGARLLEQRNARPDTLVPLVSELVSDAAMHDNLAAALGRLHVPDAAAQIATRILRLVKDRNPALALGEGEAGHSGSSTVHHVLHSPSPASR